MEAVQTSTEPLSFESIMAAFREVAEKQKEVAEHQKESDKRLERMFREGDDRLEKMFKETDRQLSKFGNRYGEVIVHLVKPKIREKLRRLGLHFNKIYQPYYADEKDRIITEVDIFLENEEKAMLVEIKSKPSIDDIKEHLDRLERFRVWADKKGDKRKFLGAIAGMVFNENEKKFAMKNGFYIIEPAGETFTINAPKGEYSPKEW